MNHFSAFDITLSPTFGFFKYHYTSSIIILQDELELNINVVFKFDIAISANGLNAYVAHLKFGDIEQVGMDAVNPLVICIHNTITDLILIIDDKGDLLAIDNLIEIKLKWLKIRQAVLDLSKNPYYRQAINQYNYCLNDLSGKLLLKEFKNNGVFRLLFSGIHQKIISSRMLLPTISVSGILPSQLITLNQILDIKERTTFYNSRILNLQEVYTGSEMLDYTGNIEFEISEKNSYIKRAVHNKKIKTLQKEVIVRNLLQMI